MSDASVSREQRMAEETLRENDRQLRLLVENMGDVISRHLPDSTITYVSPSCRALIGYTPEELVHTRAADYVHPDDVQATVAAIQEATERHGEHYRAQHRMKCKDGKYIWVETSGRLLYGTGGHLREIQCIVRDVTERKRSEQERLAHLHFLENMERVDRTIKEATDVDQMMDNVLDVVLSIFRCDRAWLLYPCDPDAPSWRVPMERTRPEYPGVFDAGVECAMTPDVAAALRDLLASGEPLAGELNPGDANWDPEDKYSVRSNISMAIFPKVGKPWDFGLHQCSHARVWTDQEQTLFKEIGHRLAESLSALLYSQDLRKSEERHRQFVKSFQGIAYQADVESFKPHLLEGTVEQVTGYAAHDFLSEAVKWSDLVHPEDAAKMRSEIERLLSEPDYVADSEYRILRKGGDVCWVRDVGRLVQVDERTLVQGTVVDITDRKRAEGEREELIAKLEAQNAELERFTYTVSHDLKSPLITIKGFVGMLRQELGEEDGERVEDDLSRISNAADKMDHLLRDLLELSRIGRLANPSESVSLEELAGEARDLVGGQVKARGVQIEISPDLPVVYGDRTRLLEVLQNLIDNAVKYMGDQPQPRIEIGVRSDENETVCYVRDNGIGLEPRYHEKVFGLFDQLDPSIDGTGIGLALVKRIVEVHGGRIWVESNGAGHGSTFCFTLAARTDSPDLGRNRLAHC
jgi:two-component system, LuxR family, sensor kinase FixL